MPTTTHTAPAPSPTASLPLLLGAGLVAILLIVLLFKGAGTKLGTQKLDPKRVDKARKRYIAAMDRRLRGKVEQYSVLLDARNMVAGYYEQKGQIVGARFLTKDGHCKRCRDLDGKEFSLLEPEKLAAVTPPLHGEVRRGVRCVATLAPLRAETERPQAKTKA